MKGLTFLNYLNLTICRLESFSPSLYRIQDLISVEQSYQNVMIKFQNLYYKKQKMKIDEILFKFLLKLFVEAEKYLSNVVFNCSIL